MATDLKFSSAIGSFVRAQTIADRARNHVGAFRDYLDARGVTDSRLDRLPATDKASYLMRSKYADLLGDDYASAYTIFASSGSSGHASYWPQLKTGQEKTAYVLRSFLERTFAIDRKRTLAIVGLALGSWIGGDHVSWAPKSMAIQTPYPFTVFSPGSRHDEILNMLQAAGPFVDQIILFVCPSAIGHLRLRADQRGIAWPAEKMRFVTLGEPFPETMRIALQAESRRLTHEPVLISIYGSADTGVLGGESALSVAIRQALSENSQTCARLGLTWPPPHLFHVAADDAYLETIAGELHITRWQGIPLVRYNLHDAASLIRWNSIRGALLDALPARHRLREPLEEAIELPDIIAITGRADRCLILCGTNITESMLQETVRSPEVSATLTGAFRARIAFDGSLQRLAVEVEIRPDATTNADELYKAFVTALGRAQPEFAEDWKNVYSVWDSEPSRRIIRLTTTAWPALSDAGTIKQTGIVT